MTVTIREGGYYKTRDGRKVGPMMATEGIDIDKWPWFSNTYGYHAVGPQGESCILSHDDDLIAEWTDGPVRTVTRTVTEIVPGNYGIVMVYMVGKSVRTEFNRSDAGPAELKAAAAVLLELAGALDSE